MDRNSAGLNSHWNTDDQKVFARKNDQEIAPERSAAESWATVKGIYRHVVVDLDKPIKLIEGILTGAGAAIEHGILWKNLGLVVHQKQPRRKDREAGLKAIWGTIAAGVCRTKLEELGFTTNSETLVDQIIKNVNEMEKVKAKKFGFYNMTTQEQRKILLAHALHLCMVPCLGPQKLGSYFQEILKLTPIMGPLEYKDILHSHEEQLRTACTISLDLAFYILVVLYSNDSFESNFHLKIEALTSVILGCSHYTYSTMEERAKMMNLAKRVSEGKRRQSLNNCVANFCKSLHQSNTIVANKDPARCLERIKKELPQLQAFIPNEQLLWLNQLLDLLGKSSATEIQTNAVELIDAFARIDQGLGAHSQFLGIVHTCILNKINLVPRDLALQAGSSVPAVHLAAT